MSPDHDQSLSIHLDALDEQVDRAAWRRNDPIELVWAFDAPADRELVALLVSCLAYGRVAQLKEAACQLLEVLGPEPYEALLGAEDIEASFGEALGGFVYRMTKGVDLIDLLSGAQAVLREHGSLESAYLSLEDGDHLARASHLVQLLRAGRRRESLERGFRYLLPDPGDGGACKRLHLFMRWVVRGPDEVDLGLWPRVSPRVLRMPLDAHTSKLCRYLGLTTRKSNDGKTVEQITAALRALDAQDPIRYDFALCHLGISGSCIHRRSEEHCPSCPIEQICTLD